LPLNISIVIKIIVTFIPTAPSVKYRTLLQACEWN